MTFLNPTYSLSPFHTLTYTIPDIITTTGTQTITGTRTYTIPDVITTTRQDTIIPSLTSAQWETLQKMLADYEQLKKEHDELKKEHKELKKHVYFLVDRISVEQTFNSIEREVCTTQVNDTK